MSSTSNRPDDEEGVSLTPQNVIQQLMMDRDEIEAIVVILERTNGTSNLMWSQMEKRDLWWQVSNAMMRLWHIIGGPGG